MSANMSGTLNSTAANTTTPSTAGDEEIYDISALSHSLNVMISFLTIVFNGIIIKVLLHHRQKFSEVTFQQTLCLSVTDFIAGFPPATSCFLLIEGFNRSFRACGAFITVSMGAQLAVMINLSFLSIRRWLVLRNVSKPKANVQNTSSKRTLLYLLGPWIITAVCMTPLIRTVILHGTTKANGCLSLDVYRENGNAHFYSAVNILFLVLLTIFYICSIIALKRIRSNMNALQSRNQRLQAKAFQHLIAVLVVANVTTLPFVMCAILSITNTVRNTQLLYISSQILVASSFVNPIVYSFQISQLKDVIMKSLNPNCLRVFCGRNNSGEVYTDQTGRSANRRY